MQDVWITGVDGKQYMVNDDSIVRYEDFDGTKPKEKSQYYLLDVDFDFIDISLKNNTVPFIYQRVSIMSRIWRAFRKENVDGLRDLRLAKYEIDRWITFMEGNKTLKVTRFNDETLEKRKVTEDSVLTPKYEAPSFDTPHHKPVRE